MSSILVILFLLNCITSINNQRNLIYNNLKNTNTYINKSFGIYFDNIIKSSNVIFKSTNEDFSHFDIPAEINNNELIKSEFIKIEGEFSRLFESFTKSILIKKNEVIYTNNISLSELDTLKNSLSEDAEAEIIFLERKTYVRILNNINLESKQVLKEIFLFELTDLISYLENENTKIDLLQKEKGFFSSKNSEFYSQQSICKVNDEGNYIFYLSEFNNIEGAIKTYNSNEYLSSKIFSIIINSIISCVILISIIIFSFLMIIYKNTSLLKEIETQREAYKDLSNKDGLTDVYNRRYFNQWLDIIQNGPFYRKIISSIIMIDINSFKKINDSYGHLIGDEVLKIVSSIIKSQIRTTDYLMRDLNGLSNENMVIRYGGDEFVVFLKRCNENNAINITEVISDKIGEIDRFPFKIKISYGIAEINEKITIVEALNIADKKMYEMKENAKGSK